MNEQSLCQPWMFTEYELSKVISLCLHRLNQAVMYGSLGPHGFPLHVHATLARVVWRNSVVHLWFLHFKNVPVKFLVPDLLASTSGTTTRSTRAVCFLVLFLPGLLLSLAVQSRRELLPSAQKQVNPTISKVAGFHGQLCSVSHHLSCG